MTKPKTTVASKTSLSSELQELQDNWRKAIEEILPDWKEAASVTKNKYIRAAAQDLTSKLQSQLKSDREFYS